MTRGDGFVWLAVFAICQGEIGMKIRYVGVERDCPGDVFDRGSFVSLLAECDAE